MRDSGLKVDADCRTGIIEYTCKVGDEYIDVDRQTFEAECCKSFLETQSSINSLAQKLNAFDHDFWSRHALIVVPTETLSIWARFRNALYNLFSV